MFSEIEKILKLITNQGFEAYVVGGFVRDYLLDRDSNDVDICTNAKVNDLIKIFPQGKVNYLQAGLSFKTKDKTYTISTFRLEKNYHKRTPKDIQFIDDVILDLKRRDFTINTLLLDKDLQIHDYLNGKADILTKTIREVADVTTDALRILRAIRLATVLNFTIDAALDIKLKQNAYLINNLSKARIEDEIDKILSSDNWEYGFFLLKK